MSKRKRYFTIGLPILCVLIIWGIIYYFLICYAVNPEKTVDFTIQYLIAVGTVSAVIVALFIEPYKRWCYRPILEICPFDSNNLFMLNQATINVHNNTYDGLADGFILRLVAKNNGLGWAEDVQIRIESYTDKKKDSDEKQVSSIKPVPCKKLAPVNLVWTNQHDPNEPYQKRTTLRKMYLALDYYCDLAVIVPPISNFVGIDEDTFVELMTGVKPNNNSNRVFPGSGVAKYKLTIFAKNFMPATYILSLSYKQWTPVLSQMLDKEFLEIKITPES